MGHSGDIDAYIRTIGACQTAHNTFHIFIQCRVPDAATGCLSALFGTVYHHPDACLIGVGWRALSDFDIRRRCGRVDNGFSVRFGFRLKCRLRIRDRFPGISADQENCAGDNNRNLPETCHFGKLSISSLTVSVAGFSLRRSPLPRPRTLNHAMSPFRRSTRDECPTWVPP